MERIGLSSLFILLVIGLTGCNSTPRKPIPDDPFYAPVIPEAAPTKVEPTGSIFMDGQVSGLYSDIRAHKVGDIITVNLVESTKAKKSANNEIKKGSDSTLDPLAFLGQNATINGQRIDFKYKDSFNTKREAGADQSNSLNGNISANVIKVLSNGNLMIRGEKWISINSGDEFIRVTGIVRSEDISPNNTIESQRIANARIQYSGTGSFADSQKVGWLNKFFLSDWWPF
ncbi:MAG: flagellar basal body L-ring protein FlgH [Parashewanella sp.]